MPSTDPGSDVKSQSTGSVEVPLEKDSDGKGGGTERIPPNRGEKEEDPEAVDVKFNFGTDENGNEDMDEFIEVFIEAMPDLGPTLGTGTLSGAETTRDADSMSCVSNDKSQTAGEEELSDKVECRKELILAEKCVSGYAKSVAEECISHDLESLDAFNISDSSEPNSSRLECAVVLPSVANESTDVNISLEPLNAAVKKPTDIDVGSEPLQNNNSANNSRFINVLPLPDGSVEIVLENGAWSSDGPDEERYLDLEFPFMDEQAWLGCDILEF